MGSMQTVSHKKGIGKRQDEEEFESVAFRIDNSFLFLGLGPPPWL